jgi:hypothetical protein
VTWKFLYKKQNFHGLGPKKVYPINCQGLSPKGDNK